MNVPVLKDFAPVRVGMDRAGIALASPRCREQKWRQVRTAVAALHGVNENSAPSRVWARELTAMGRKSGAHRRRRDDESQVRLRFGQLQGETDQSSCVPRIPTKEHTMRNLSHGCATRRVKDQPHFLEQQHARCLWWMVTGSPLSIRRKPNPREPDQQHRLTGQTFES
jgi:hypothetical protein